jgi:hypothetical protein
VKKNNDTGNDKRCRVGDYGRKNVNVKVEDKEDTGGKIKIHKKLYPKDYTCALVKISKTRDVIFYNLFKK